MGRVDRQGRQDREQAGQEGLLQGRLVRLAEAFRRDEGQALARELRGQVAPLGLLVGHQVLGLGVDPLQLLGRGQAVLAHRAHAFADLGLQAGHPDHVELVEVVRRDGQEPQPLQKGMAGIAALGEDPAVEGQPGQLAVEEALGRAHELPVQRRAAGPVFGLGGSLGEGHGRGSFRRSVASARSWAKPVTFPCQGPKRSRFSASSPRISRARARVTGRWACPEASCRRSTTSRAAAAERSIRRTR